MVREDLVAGLRNALEKGESLESAKYSFISAGYPPNEVEEAARYASSGQAVQPSPAPQQPATQQPTSTQTMQPPKQTAGPPRHITSSSEKEPIKEKITGNLKVISLIVILAILIIIFVLTLIFRETIIGWFS
jgi:hypothetical protein